MQKQNIANIIFWATIALLIPFFGNMFVNGWNWGFGDFVFAWIFFVVFGLTYTFLTSKITQRVYKIVVGVVVVFCFALVWVMFATG